jgi:lipid A 3-O-deacylase
MIRKTTIASAFALAAVSSVHAADGASFEMGTGNESTDLWRAGLQWSVQRRWFTERSWTLGAYWDLQAGRWSSQLTPGEPQQELWDISLTPVFRLERAARTPLIPYAEAAIGFHLLSDLRVNSERSFSTRFQYGDHLGFGVRYGPRYRYDFGIRLQHLSNGGIAKPNPGINFLEARLAYRF